MKYYDEYTSLGGNCEIGFQFRRYGKEPSSLFSWLVSDIDKIIHVLSNDFEDFFEFEDLIPYAHDMVKSKKSGFAFHTAMKSALNKDKKYTFIHSIHERKEFFKRQKSKYLYLIDKWNNLAHSNKKVVYYIKDMYKYTNVQLQSLEKIFLKKYPNHKFKIVVIREGKIRPRMNLTDNIDICYINFFSDKSYPAVAIIDLNAWSEIFDLYPLREKKPESIEWIKSECKFKRDTRYSLSMNYNLAQFYEKLGFLSNSRYFLERAKEMSSEKFIDKEYLRIVKKIQVKEETTSIKKSELLRNFYALSTKKAMDSYIYTQNLLAWKYDNKPIEVDIYDEIRYIRLSLQEEVCLHLNEIEVINLKGENVALGKSIMMSSTYKEDKPSNNKNFTNGIIDGSPSFHTQTEKNPWVVLDLEDYAQIETIKIYNRDEFTQRALSLNVEVSRNLKEWKTVFDNFWFLKKLDLNLLNEEQRIAIQTIFKFDNHPIEIPDVEAMLMEIFKKLENNKILSEAKLVKYALLFKFKSFHRIKQVFNESIDRNKENIILQDAVYLCYGDSFTFTLESGLEKMDNLKYLGVKNIYNEEILYDLMKILKSIKYLNFTDEEYIKFFIFSKFKALARIHGDLKKSKNKEETLKLIGKAIEKTYGKGYILTQHGIVKNIESKYNLEARVNIVNDMNQIFSILKNKLNIDAYIVSGTLLGAKRAGEFISHDDDFDSAYLSNETTYPNIWLESLQIIEVLPVRIEPIIGGLVHLIVDFNQKFKLDLFTGWLEGEDYYRYPLPPKILKKEDVVPLKKLKLYGVDISTPASPEKSLINNYGVNWEVPDPSWRFDWKAAKIQYGDSLICLKDEDPLKNWVKKNIPILKKTAISERKSIIINSNQKSEVIMQLSECKSEKNANILLIMESYFLVKDKKHDIFVEFVKENPRYTFRYLGRIKSRDAVIEFKGIV
ncbi:MAG: DUF1796 family putative cysteine peptidase [Sulfurovum sp.]|nr:DUF1796 family putative cysteine peptidase [Sulfurovum sp.]